MGKTKKYYAVRRGRHPGIYPTWDLAKAQIDGYSGAQYKSFQTKREASAYLYNEQAPITETEGSHTQRPEIIVFTDGGSRNHGNVAGGHVKSNDKAAWAYLIDAPTGQHVDSGGEYGVTNNRMEIMALVRALQWLSEHQLNHAGIGVVSDSRYVLNAITKHWIDGWKKRGWKRSGGELKNKELWQQLDELLHQFSNIQFGWTKGHATNKGNVFVDEKLNQTMDKM
ncbi:ribonuclease H family protein [Fructilactobacillus fructivorans]|uniref:Ribonuclease H n=1 Tax=Fructilactobacillus fructivorans TaxID=1614 RepID=A0A0C1PMI2_9LACO|nr:ribonuclease H family protein [Fructilactobacillus fructivorans]KID41967.1 Ribonuclease HI [Fructilactobacillus fructivorans]MCT0151624.1 reverse transcriptase-like protein [Fructilactobacillus fructivorans]MCT2867247.1 reverse transcriptase-like protein [Fructilactobacillus fructivorans]MCT2868192.1 reverse transcriptase-like protein [Fructilactobacillus fructivorans]MCT2872900.1 reverse transcriptase-like protein [Fructilactobacillus fructivorans]